MSARPSDQWLSPESMETSVSLVAGTTFIGLVTVVNASPVTLGMSPNFVGLATVDVGNDAKYSYTAFTSCSTIAIKATAGFVHLFNIGRPSCPTITLYDSAVPSGTMLHRIGANYPMGSHKLDVSFANGLTLDATAGPDITPQILVAWK